MSPGFWVVLGLVIGWFSGRARRRRQVPPPIPPSPPPSTPSSDIYIPGRNFPEILGRLGSGESLLDVILNSMHEGVLILNPADRIVLLNPSAGSILGMGEQEALGRSYLEAIRHPGLVDLLAGVKRDARPAVGEIELPGTEERVFAVSADALRSKEGTTLGLIVVLADITSVKKLVRMRSDFVANVTHELKTPLTAILGYVETLQDGAIDDAKNRKSFLQKIHDQSSRLHELITDVLELSRIESGRYVESLAPVDVVKVCRTAQDLLRAKAEARRVTIRCGLPDGLSVQGHEDGLLRVMVNLLDNAVKYSPEGGTVAVAASRSGDRIAVSVRDEGPGIPIESQSRVFERFYRVESSRSRQAGGTGLGLSIVKHLVERMRGGVRLESREGRGSLFTIELPAAD
jgi:two-component system phosphate regulon sensor histidine kinase PhoR